LNVADMTRVKKRLTPFRSTCDHNVVLYLLIVLLVVMCVVLFIVCVQMCTVLLPTGVNPIAVNKYRVIEKDGRDLKLL
jgi:uncharacterized membrane protein